MLQDVSSSVRRSEFFSVLADKTSDVSNKEQLIVCVRWVDDNFEAHEEFLGLQQLEQCSAVSIANEIKQVLKSMDLPLGKLRGQCYDRCSTMASPNAGVSAMLKKKNLVLCTLTVNGHATNLSCSDSIKQIKLIKDAHKLCTKSPNSSNIPQNEKLICKR